MENPKNSRISFLKNKTYQLAFKLGTVFIITSILGTIIGNFLDSRFGIKPYGTLISLGIFYLITWVIIFRVYSQIKKETQSYKRQEQEILQDKNK